MSNRGGKRKGAGRPAGSLNQKTREIAEKALADGLSPLEVMLTAMRMFYASGDMNQAMEAAAKAAPYVHPRLSAVECDVHSDKDIISPVVIFKIPDNGRS